MRLTYKVRRRIEHIYQDPGGRLSSQSRGEFKKICDVDELNCLDTLNKIYEPRSDLWSPCLLFVFELLMITSSYPFVILLARSLGSANSRPRQDGNMIISWEMTGIRLLSFPSSWPLRRDITLWVSRVIPARPTWAYQAALHAVRFLEAGGLESCIHVYRAADHPLLNAPARLAAWEAMHGPLPWQGAFTPYNTTAESLGANPTSGDDLDRIVRVAFKGGIPNTTYEHGMNAAKFLSRA